MSDLLSPGPVELAQMKITPNLPTPAEPNPAMPTPSLPGSSGGGLGINPSLPGGSAISPSLPGGSAPSSSTSAPGAAPSASGANFNITITNPDNLPQLPPGQNELKLVIQDPSKQLPADSGLGFFEIFLAIIAALIIAPFVQREAGKCDLCISIDIHDRLDRFYDRAAAALYVRLFVPL